MTKEQLIKLKQNLDKIKFDNYVLLNKFDEDIYDELDKHNIFEIYQQKNTNETIEILLKNIENLIYYLFITGRQFDSISIYPSFNFYIKEKDYNKADGTIKDKPKILEDIVSINFYNCKFSNRGEEIELEAEKIPNYIFNKSFIISLNEFSTELTNKGLILEDIKNIEDVMNKTYGKITIMFPPKKERILR